jgi:uncharacterized protein (TIGR03435 family)
MNSWMHIAGWVLVHFVWQGALLAIAAAFVLRLCRHQSASVRYGIACGALAAMLAAVIVTTARIEPPVPDVRTGRTSVRAASDGTTDVMLPIEITDNAANAPSASVPRIEIMLPWIVSTWLAGVALLLLRIAAGWWRVRNIHNAARSAVRSRWETAGYRMALRLGIRRVVRIVELPHIDVPLVVGCLRPIVVMPIAALAQLSAAQVEAILAHELAHVRRHDYLVNLMQTMAETLLFYHPGVWWLSARIRDEREHCCDDVAVAVCGDRVGYAAALAELEEWRNGTLQLAPAATGGSLLNRVRRILRVEVSEDSRMSSSTMVFVALAVASAVTVTAIAQQPEPRPKFEVASVRPNASGDNKMSARTLPGGRYEAINIPLRLLIINSYGLQQQQLVGAPDWISSERFDIVAKAEGDLGPPVARDGSPSRLQLMVRSLLEERFKLEVHREPRQVEIYALVPVRADGRLGPELKPSAVDCDAIRAARRKGGPPQEVEKPGERPQCGARLLAGELIVSGQPLQELVSTLAGTVGRSVIDRTGLKGNYDIHLKWTPDFIRQRTPGETIRLNGIEFDPSGPSIFTALQEQLGLKLESERGTVEALVIDRIERPTPD